MSTNHRDDSDKDAVKIPDLDKEYWLTVEREHYHSTVVPKHVGDHKLKMMGHCNTLAIITRDAT